MSYRGLVLAALAGLTICCDSPAQAGGPQGPQGYCPVQFKQVYHHGRHHRIPYVWGYLPNGHYWYWYIDPAEVISARGQYVLAVSQAMCYQEMAREHAMENDLQRIRNHFAAKKINRLAREEERARTRRSHSHPRSGRLAHREKSPSPKGAVSMDTFPKAKEL